MNWPGLCFGLLWIPAIGLGVYAWRGRGGLLWMLASLLFTAVGFLGGHYLALSRQWSWGRVGPWALGPALLGSFLVLMGAYALLRPISVASSWSSSTSSSEEHHE